MSHPFGELAIPSIEVGFEERGSDYMWDRRLNHPAEDGYGRWNDFLSEPSASPYNISPSGTPIAQSPERSMSSRKNSPKDSPKHSPKMSPTAASSMESEEERRKSRKREQNRESQRNFRRRQENRVKFLESKTLELEASSRQLRAENERLKTELVQAHHRNDELFAMVSMPTTPVSAPLDMAYDQRRGPQASQQQQHSQRQQQQQQQQQRYSPPNMALPLSFDLNEEQFYVPPAVMQNSSQGGW